MKTESFIGLRYLWNTRRTRFLSVITVICVLGISIGVAALICVQSIMDGLQNQMKKTILGAKAHISVEHIEGEFRDYENIRTEILKHEEISGVTPIISRDVIFSSNDEMIGAVLNGIDPATAETALLLPSQIISGSLECLEEPSTCSAIIEKRMKDPSKILKRDLENESGKTRYPGIAIGSELAKFYGIDIGDVMKVISPVGGGMGPAGPVPLIRSFQVAAVFYSGLYEYDLN
ncbi:MAG TPA: ABC transporter permease, partial [bacterium]|nr:ABC transporter permease [bacterium]